MSTYMGGYKYMQLPGCRVCVKKKVAMRPFFLSIPLIVFLRARKFVNSRCRALRKLLAAVLLREDVEPTIQVLAIQQPNVKAKSDVLQTLFQSVIKVADELHERGDPQRTYHYLKQFADVDDSQILWRYGRSCSHLYQLFVMRDEQMHKRRKVVDEGLRAMQRAVDLDGENSHCIHWLGNLRGCDLELNPLQSGFARKVLACKEYFMKATKLDPLDWEAWHSLGEWHYAVLSHPAYKLNIFQVMGIKASAEEGLYSLLKANEVNSKPSCSNWLLIGKCCLIQGRRNEAKVWFQRIVDFKQPSGFLDENAREEARKLLKDDTII